MEEEIFQLKGGRIDTFLENWRKVESNILSVASSDLKCGASRKLVATARDAQDTFGNIND